MSTREDAAAVLETVADLLAVSADLAAGKAPDPHEVAKVLARTAGALGAVDQLRDHLSQAAAARVDDEVDAAVDAKLAGR